MLINLSHQTGCWITQNEANSRNGSAPQVKTFEALERSITRTRKAIPRVSQDCQNDGNIWTKHIYVFPGDTVKETASSEFHAWYEF